MKKRMLIPCLLLFLTGPFLDGQNEGAEKTKLPVQAGIVRNKSLLLKYEIGNVVVGWEVYQLNANGKTFASYHGLYLNDHLIVCDHGRVVANLQSAKAFIEGWDFTKDGEHLVIKSRGAHGAATIEFFSLRNGPAEESVQAYEKNLPDWATPFADPD